MKVPRVLLATPAILLFCSQGFAEDITREQAGEMMKECRVLREQKIAPLKEKVIEDCINKRRRDRDYCERFHKDYGEFRRAGGILRPGMFWDLPVCQDAVNAENYLKKYPGELFIRKMHNKKSHATLSRFGPC